MPAPAARPERLTYNDTLILEICQIMEATQPLSRHETRDIERHIKSAPRKIVRRDTARYLLETALAVAYYEFDRKDYRKALTFVDEFYENAMPTDFWEAFWRFGSVGYRAKMSLIQKGNIKWRSDKNSWSQIPDTKRQTRGTEYADLARSKASFLDSFIDDVPVDCELGVYRRLLTAYRDAGGTIGWFNLHGYGRGFLQRCVDNDREDIIDLVCEILEVDRSCIRWNDDKQRVTYIEPERQQNSTPSVYYALLLNYFDPAWHKNEIDSLINCNQSDSIGKHLLSMLTLNYEKHKYAEIIRDCRQYEPVCPAPTLTALYSHWGLAEIYTERYDSAVMHIEQAIAHATVPGAITNLYNDLACAYTEAGDYTRAIEIFHQHKPDPPTPFNMFCMYDNLGYTYSFINPGTALLYYEAAEEYLESGSAFLDRKARHFCRKAQMLTDKPYQRRQAIEQAFVYTREPFCDSLTEAIVYTELGRFYNDIFDYERAERAYARAARYIKTLPPTDKRVGYLERNRAANLRELKPATGDEVSGEIADLDERMRRTASPLGRLRLDLQRERLSRGRDDYDSVCAEIITRAKHDIPSILLSLSTDENASVQWPLQMLMDGMMEASADCRNLLALSLFKKGLLYNTRAVVEHRLKSRRRTRGKMRKLSEMRERLNFAIAYGDRDKINQLSVSIPQYERDLNMELASDGDLLRQMDRSIEQVTARLRDGDAAVDFVRYNRDGRPTYGAFVIKASEAPVFINLFDETADSVTGAAVWAPLLPHLVPGSRVYFSTDGILNRTGIEFLSPDGDVLMAHRYRMHRVFHLSEIRDSDLTVGDRIAVIGVSDHNSPVAGVETAYRRDMVDLPNVEYEIKLIESKYPKSTVEVLLNDAAREHDVKQMDTRNITALHISTHGFYIDNQSLPQAARDPASPDHYIARRALDANKSTLSGLVLRGGNLSWKTPEIMDDEDDILTAEEIETMDFPRLRLTVLSACESGLGNIDSDGMWGLQRAFRIAGAQNLICALNKVDDYWTAQFMDIFYDEASRGRSIYDCFNTAQRTLYEMEPASPGIWSSFILIE